VSASYSVSSPCCTIARASPLIVRVPAVVAMRVRARVEGLFQVHIN
jgi:hypothetical protein